MSGGLADFTNDPGRRSWVDAANRPGADFPIQNLPFAVFKPRGSAQCRGGVAIGDQIVDLAALAACGALSGTAAVAGHAAARPTLNDLMELGPAHWSALRGALADALLEGSALRSRLMGCLTPQDEAEYSLPATIGDYTDFYSSIHHATTVGRMFRPDHPLLPNYQWLPVGYHGRSSSIGVSGTDIRRPLGQRASGAGAPPTLGPTLRLDYEVELGIFIGRGNPLGSPIPVTDAEAHIFGLCLLNDWSARDLQAWEYQPLGPFLAKNFATTISPWIVSLQALAPYRRPLAREPSDPEPLPYLASDRNRSAGAFDIRLEAFIESQAMHSRNEAARRLSSTSFRHAYWTVAQLVAHHTVNGCNLRAGDLLGTGTQSGPTPEEAGSLLELTAGGTRPIAIGGDEQRTFLEDGDQVSITGWCERPGQARIGFGHASARVLPATAAL